APPRDHDPHRRRRRRRPGVRLLRAHPGGRAGHATGGRVGVPAARQPRAAAGEDRRRPGRRLHRVPVHRRQRGAGGRDPVRRRAQHGHPPARARQRLRHLRAGTALRHRLLPPDRPAPGQLHVVPLVLPAPL
ncbi:MAG: hypothetical protein AVDCRST_MAG10-3110, partial [uncultured Acidimicrobiales bacterium]